MKFKNFIFALLFIGALGGFGHFFYNWSDKNTIVGYFFPVNESIWEHLKLLFFPTVLFSIIEYFAIKDKVSGYAPSVAISLMVGLMTIVTIFYTYSGVLGFKIEWFNIAIYYIALIVMLIIKWLLLNSGIINGKLATILSLIWFLAMAIMFVVFTYNPLEYGIFEKP